VKLRRVQKHRVNFFCGFFDVLQLNAVFHLLSL
jgi:hypothetical protein